MAVVLPVTVLFSREEPVSPDVRAGGEFAVAASIARPRVDRVAVTSTGAVTSSYLLWGGDAAQSASMVLVGTLLIGIGSIVRRGMSL